MQTLRPHLKTFITPARMKRNKRGGVWIRTGAKLRKTRIETLFRKHDPKVRQGGGTGSAGGSREAKRASDSAHAASAFASLGLVELGLAVARC